MTNFMFFNFISGSKGSFSRKVISYKNDSNTVILKITVQSSEDCCHPNYIFFKNESFHKGVMLVSKLVLSNILLSWKEKEFLNALETTRIVQPKLV